MWNEQFFKYLLKEGYIQQKLWDKWYTEFQNVQKRADQESLPMEVLTPHDETRIIKLSSLPSIKEVMTEVEITEENNAESNLVQSPNSKDEFDLLMELEKFSKNSNELEIVPLKSEKKEKLFFQKEEKKNVDTKVFRLYQDQFQEPLKEPDTQINPMMQIIDISLASAEKYLEKALQEKQKGILVEEHNKKRRAEHFLVALQYLTLAYYLDPEYNVVQSEKIEVKNLLFQTID